MSAAPGERFSRPRGLLVLWAGLLVPPAVWMLHLLVVYSLQRYVCRSGAVWLFHAATVASLLPIAATTWLAWRAWGQLGRSTETGAADVHSRSRFLALWGVVFGLVFMLLILVEWIPTHLLAPCA